MQVKFENWTLSLKKGGVFAKKGNKIHKVKKFEERGLIALPKELLELIRNNLRHANTYDRFLDKYYDITEKELLEEKSINEQ